MAAVSLKPSAKGVTVLVIVAVLILFGCVLAYLGAAGKLKGATAELRDKEKQLAASQEMAQKLERSKLDYLDARSQVRYLESSVSTHDYVPTLLKQIEHLGTSVKLDVLGVRPQPESKSTQPRSVSSGKRAAEGDVQGASQPRGNDKKEEPEKRPPYGELKIDLEINGEYLNALDFLYKLTSFPKIIAVNTMEMAPAQCKGGLVSPTLSIRMNVTAFITREDKPAAKPETADEPPAAAVRPVGGKGTDNEAG